MSATNTDLFALQFKPGVNRQSTTYAEEGTWYDSEKILFRDGLPENRRGRQTYNVSSFVGTARDLILWTDNEGEDRAAFGTECFLYVNEGGINFDITPVRASAVLSAALNTQSGSFFITVSAPLHDLSLGDHVDFNSQNVTVGGNVYLEGVYDVVSVPGNGAFIVSYASAADGTSFSNANINADYYLPCGLSGSVPGTGYGTGFYGASAYGTPRGAGSFTLQQRQWSLDAWGEDLVANPRGFGIYVWEENDGTGSRAQLIAAAPSIVDFMFVTDERHMVAIGCVDEITSAYDPLLVRWSDKENYNQWVAAVTNAAGGWRLGGGSHGVGAVRSKNQNLVWTDTNVYAMRYRTDGFVYGFTKLGEECGLIAPHAAVDFNGIVYWMSKTNFYMYDGRVRQMQSTLHKDVYERLTVNQQDKIYAGTNEEFGEIIWLMPSTSSDDCDFYVIHNTREDLWYWGTYDYTTWADKGVFAAMMGTRASAGRGDLVYVEPKGIYTNDGVPYESFIKSADKDLSDGDNIMFADRFLPDFQLEGGAEINVTFQVHNEAAQDYRTKGPYIVSVGTRRIPLRLRGRMAAITIACSVPGSWRYGKPRLDVKPDGKR